MDTIGNSRHELKIALGQFDVILGDSAANLETVARLAAAAAAEQADILVLPELWSTGYDLENAGSHATGIASGIFRSAAELAAQHSIHLLGSCLSLISDNSYGNTAVLFDDQGASIGAYSKGHLFGLMAEQNYLTAGDKLALLDTKWGKVGLAVCYDLRFPELFRAYALGGAKIVFLPSEWPHPRMRHWRTLLRARAIENQMFIVACNRVGSSRGFDFFGHSCIIDPWGETVVEGGEGAALIVAQINVPDVEATRSKMPVLSDRRPNLYSSLWDK